MVRKLFLGWCPFLLAAPAALANEPTALTLETHPTAVTVYLDQAKITRQGSLDIPAGDSLVAIHGLPASLVSDSLVAAGRLSDGNPATPQTVAIGSVEIHPEHTDPAHAAQYQAEIQALDDQIAAIDVRIAGFDAAAQYIDHLTQAGTDKGSAPGPLAPDRWKTAWHTLQEGMTETKEGKRQAELERRALSLKKAALEADHGPDHPGNITSTGVVISLHADRPSRVTLELGYQIPHATWYPVYEARLESGGHHSLILTEAAMVSQATGEDWHDIALTLATTRPTAGVAPPELDPWSVDLLERRERNIPARSEYMASSIAMSAPMPASVSADASPEPAPDLPLTAAQMVMQGLAVEYRIPATTSLVSGKAAQRVRVTEMKTEAALTAKTAPRLDTHAFLMARFTSPAQTPLLPGPVALYLDGVFVGTGALPLLQSGAEQALPFGRDDRITVQFQTLEEKDSSNGLPWSRKRVEQNKYLMTVQNFHDQPMEISVLDHAPVSKNDDLTVALTSDPAPSLADSDHRSGVMTWTASYAPKQQRQIHWGYSLTAPADQQIIR